MFSSIMCVYEGAALYANDEHKVRKKLEHNCLRRNEKCAVAREIMWGANSREYN